MKAEIFITAVVVRRALFGACALRVPSLGDGRDTRTTKVHPVGLAACAVSVLGVVLGLGK